LALFFCACCFTDCAHRPFALQASTAPTAPVTLSPAQQALVDQLAAMGFEGAHVQRCVRDSHAINVDQAIEWLCEHPEPPAGSGAAASGSGDGDVPMHSTGV